MSEFNDDEVLDRDDDLDLAGQEELEKYQEEDEELEVPFQNEALLDVVNRKP